jgi:hypothetical protein
MSNLTKAGSALIPADVSAIKIAIALDLVDNTPDASKPVSALQAAAIGAKADATATTAALLLKAPLASPAFTGTPTGITKTHVGLPNVDNTADTAKPVSVLQAAANVAAAAAAVALSVQKAANLSDVADVPTARTNLGLGTAAVAAASAFDAAGAAATAQANAIITSATTFSTLAALNTAIAAGSLATTPSGQRIAISTEPIGILRIWNGTNINTVQIRQGLGRTLSSNLNQIYTTNGAPTSGSSFWGTAIDGDEAVDYINNTYYTRASGAWTVVSGIYPSVLTNTQISALSTLSGGNGIPLYMGISQFGFRVFPNEAPPTVSIAIAPTPARTEKAISDPGIINPNLGLSGAKKGLFAARGGVTVATQRNVLMAARASADTAGALYFLTSVYITQQPGSNVVALGKFNDSLSGGFAIFNDNNFFGTVDYTLHSANAQAGGTNTITLALTANRTTDNYYITLNIRIVSGLGINQVATITGYVASTRVATVNSNWSIQPDASSVYSIDVTSTNISFSDNAANLKYVHLTFPATTIPVRRRLDILGVSLYSISVGATDVIEPAAPTTKIPLISVGDSFVAGSMSPSYTPIMMFMLARELGLTSIALGSGSTALWHRGSTPGRFNLLNRVIPPNEAWEVWQPAALGATAGTWTISITYNGVTSTTSALTYNVGYAAVETALNALNFSGFLASSGVSWVGPAGQGCFCVGRGDMNTPLIIIANGMVGASISFDFSGLTGLSTPSFTRYLGDVRKNYPTDAQGNDLSAVILLCIGSGNDTSTSLTTVQANSVLLANSVTTKFPKATVIFVGLLGDATIGDNNLILQSDIDRNNALKAGALLLPTINGQVPFVDTYDAGLGGAKWLDGGGSSILPTAGKTDIFKSKWNIGHPTSAGAMHLATKLANAIRSLLIPA